MFTQTKIITGTYRDSVSLMQVAAALGGLAGVDQASASMATAGNLDLLREVGLIDGAMDARPSDLLIVVRASSAAAAAAAIARAEDLLRNAGPVRAPEESNGVAGTGGDG